jgi:hypothetical protein
MADVQNRFHDQIDLHLEIDSEGRLRTKLYDKRDDFNFPIVFFTVSNFYKNLVKWALTEIESSVAGTTTLDREWWKGSPNRNHGRCTKSFS